MGQRSQIYVRYTNDKGEHFLTARYFNWNYGERMISRARHTLEWIKDNVDYADYNFIYHSEKLARIIDVNFDMHDVMIVLIALAFIFVISVLNEKGICVRGAIAKRNVVIRWAAVYALIMFIIIFGAYGKGYVAVDPIYANF